MARFHPPVARELRIQYLTTVNSSTPLEKPYGVDYFENRIFVVDSRSACYHILKPNGKTLKTVRGEGNGEFKKPINIHVDQHGNRYISDTASGKVWQYDKRDRFQRAFLTGNKFTPVDMVTFENELYVTDIKNHQIAVFDITTGDVVRTLGRRGSGKGEFFWPTGLSITSRGALAVSDTGNNRIQLIDRSGKFLHQYGQAGNGLGQFARPKGVALDPIGRVYAVDAAFEHVQIYDNEGQLLLIFGEPGRSKYNLNLPAAITISSKGIQAYASFADRRFNIQYLIFVTSQFGPGEINVYGFGKYAVN